MMLVAFDVLASDKADLERLFRLLTARFIPPFIVINHHPASVIHIRIRFINCY
jgi:hypothetical protein